MKKIILFIGLCLISISVKANTQNQIRIINERPGGYKGTTIYKATYLDKEVYWEVEDETTVALASYITKVKLELVSCDPHFVYESVTYDIDFNKNNYYEIKNKHQIKYINVNVAGFIYDNKEELNIDSYNPILKIYKDDKLMLETSEKTFSLPAGDYIIHDTTYNKYYEESLYEDIYLELNVSAINGIKSNKEITSVCDENKCYEYYYEDNIVRFNKPIYPDNYFINGIKYDLINIESVPDITENVVCVELYEDKEKNDLDDNIIIEEIIIKENNIDVNNKVNNIIEPPHTEVTTEYKKIYNLKKEEYDYFLIRYNLGY